ncbi:MAG: hypothetical protein ACPHJ3_14885 [Rubripirellula sp.]
MRSVGNRDADLEVGVFREYRAPREHGEAFVEPSLDQASRVLQANRRMLSKQQLFATIRHQARRQLIGDALRYTSVYRTPDWLAGQSVDELLDRPIVMAGHQPVLFHPGVWFKNFALSHVAQQTGALAFNLVVDNDVASGCSIRIPTLAAQTSQASYVSVPFDDAGGGVPYEQTTIQNREVFEQFAGRVKKTVAPVEQEPCVDRLWQHARAAIERCGVAGCAMAQARHGLEGELGLKTLELPLGVVCRTTAFAEFVLAILSELPRFHRCYNGAANQYRSEHGIRSTAHPVPNLDEQDGWFEAPLWIYGNQSPARRPVWVRLRDDQLLISDRAEREIEIDIRFPKLAAEKLSSMITPEFKLRPRALLTTMYARLILSDLFIHGIGGAKYDQLGDRIIHSFFMVDPPEFMVMSATVKLPSDQSSDNAIRVSQLKRELRDTRFQPERFAEVAELDGSLIERKKQLLENQPAPNARGDWHREITEITRTLAACLDGERSRLAAELVTARRQASSDAILSSREHPFCVFSLQYLQNTFSELLNQPAAVGQQS